MFSLLLAIILISFIGVGLPDSVLGTAWPAIYEEFGLPISMQAYISATVSISTAVSGLLSSKLIIRYGAGKVTAVSTLLTAVALFGFGFSGNIAFFFLLSVPLGLGAGAIDAALNNFVALHYSASKMNYLHCFYGIGVAISPFIMSLALGDSGNWRLGYLTVAALQSVITLITFLALPLWKKAERLDEEKGVAKQKDIPLKKLFSLRNVRISSFAFFFVCAVEVMAGTWSASYFVDYKNVSPDKAAAIAMLFYIGLALGRFISGLVSERIGRRRVLRISVAVMGCALILFAFPLPIAFSSFSLLLFGLGIGPAYPNLVHLTPKIHGEEIAQSVMGLQQSMASVGCLIAPWIFGIGADMLSTVILPFYMIILFLIYASLFYSLMRTIKNR